MESGVHLYTGTVMTNNSRAENRSHISIRFIFGQLFRPQQNTTMSLYSRQKINFCTIFWLFLNVFLLEEMANPALDISTGPLARRTFQTAGPVHFILHCPYGPPRYTSGHQISNSAGPNDDKSQYVLFVRAPAPHLAVFAQSFSPFCYSVAPVRVGHVNQAH